MNYIVYDLEWDENGKKEIVEIGAVKASIIDGELHVISRFQSFVRPLRHHYTYFCEQFTNIPIEIINEARTFPEVLEEFIAWIGEEEHAFCTWGAHDRSTFHHNCDMNDIPTETWMNVNNNVQIQISKLLGSDSVMNLKKAIKALEIKHDDGVYHRADFDSEATMKVMAKFIHKIKIDKNVKYKVKQRKILDININSFIFNDRKQMAIWMEDRIDSILLHLPVPIQEQIKEDVVKWEETLLLIKEECFAIFQQEDVQNLLQREKKDFFLSIQEKYPQHKGILTRMYHSCDIPEKIWKKHLYMLTFHDKEKVAS